MHAGIDIIMAKDVIVMEGIVTEALPDALFRIELDSPQVPKPLILGHLAGKLRLHRIRILAGDRVQVELSPYDVSKGRISRRL